MKKDSYVTAIDLVNRLIHIFEKEIDMDWGATDNLYDIRDALEFEVDQHD